MPTLQSILSFVKYNNAVPLIAMALFSGAGITFASSETARSSVYASASEVRSVDNSYIVNKRLSTYDYKLQILKVEENDDMYVVTYSYQTIAVVDFVWRDTTIEKTLKLSKKSLWGKDLGLEVARQIGQMLDQEGSFLAEVQKQEKSRGQTGLVIATEYRGLVGRMFDAKEEEFKGYNPLVEEMEFPSETEGPDAYAEEAVTHLALPYVPSRAEIEAIIQARVMQLTGIGRAIDPSASSTASTTATTTDPSTNTPPTLTLVGRAALTVTVGDIFTDPGVTATDLEDGTLEVTTAVDGLISETVVIDTSAVRDYTITYRATDSLGVTTEMSRIVSVIASDGGGGGGEPPIDPPPVDPPPVDPPPVDPPLPVDPPPTPEPEPEPEPTPEPPPSETPAP